MEQPMPQPVMPQGPQPIGVPQSFFSKYKFTIISLFVILLAAIPLLLLSNTTAKPVQAPKSQPAAMASPTPSPVPLTNSNADSTLSQIDTTLQNTLNQTDTDLKAAAAVNTSQDSTTGL